jgi:hypothetical protein
MNGYQRKIYAMEIQNRYIEEILNKSEVYEITK